MEVEGNILTLDNYISTLKVPESQRKAGIGEWKEFERPEDYFSLVKRFCQTLKQQANGAQESVTALVSNATRQNASNNGSIGCAVDRKERTDDAEMARQRTDTEAQEVDKEAQTTPQIEPASAHGQDGEAMVEGGEIMYRKDGVGTSGQQDGEDEQRGTGQEETEKVAMKTVLQDEEITRDKKIKNVEQEALVEKAASGEGKETEGGEVGTVSGPFAIVQEKLSKLQSSFRELKPPKKRKKKRKRRKKKKTPSNHQAEVDTGEQELPGKQKNEAPHWKGEKGEEDNATTHEESGQEAQEAEAALHEKQKVRLRSDETSPVDVHSEQGSLPSPPKGVILTQDPELHLTQTFAEQLAREEAIVTSEYGIKPLEHLRTLQLLKAERSTVDHNGHGLHNEPIERKRIHLDTDVQIGDFKKMKYSIPSIQTGRRMAEHQLLQGNASNSSGGMWELASRPTERAQKPMPKPETSQGAVSESAQLPPAILAARRRLKQLFAKRQGIVKNSETIPNTESTPDDSQRVSIHRPRLTPNYRLVRLEEMHLLDSSKQQREQQRGQ